METNVAKEKKESKRPKQASTARQQKAETMQLNGNAAIAALAKYRKKTA